MKTTCFAIFFAVTLITTMASAQTDTTFTYQGELNENGNPANGPFNIDFSLWDALSGGNQLGTTVTHTGVPVVNGKFTVELDFQANAFDNTDRWLEITVDGVTLVPRQPITRAPYAIQTRGIFVDDAGNIGIGTSTPSNPLHIESNGDIAVYAKDIAITGTTYGGRFSSASTEGRGVYGLAFATTGTNYGGQFLSFSRSGRGVLGVAAAASGTTYGGRFESFSPSGFAGYFAGNGNDAVYVENTGAGRGLQAVAPSDTAVWGQTTTGFAGVHGANAAASGRGVYGQASDSIGTNYGVYGRSDSASGFDFYAGGAGVNYGASSSRRWKSNVVPIGDPLYRLSKLQGVYFDWDEEHGGAHDVGMIAEEVGVVLPEIVQYEENGVDAIGMDYSKMTPLLVEAVNALRAEKDSEITSLRDEQRAEIASLRTEKDRELEQLRTSYKREMESLRAENEELQQRFTRLESLVSRLTTENK